MAEYLEFRLAENQGLRKTRAQMNQDFERAMKRLFSSIKQGARQSDPDFLNGIIATMERATDDITTFANGELPIG